MRTFHLSISCIVVLMLLNISCNKVIEVDDDVSHYDNTNELLMNNYQTLDQSIQVYKAKHNGNAPTKLDDLVVGNVIERIPLNPITNIPMLNVPLTSNFKAGNYFYVTYPMRYKLNTNSEYICTREYLLIVFHNGNYQSSMDMDFDNPILDSISKDVLYSSGEVLAVHKIGVNTICPSIDLVLDSNGYTCN